MHELLPMVNIFGPSAAGKSTIADLFKKRINRLYTVDFDVVKRQISGYDFKRDRDLASKLTYGTLSLVSQTGLPILVLLPPPNNQEAYSCVADIAKYASYTLLNIEITAPDEVLVERYQKRLLELQESVTKHKLKTLDEFKTILKAAYYRPSNTVSFDSSLKSPDEMFREILLNTPILSNL